MATAHNLKFQTVVRPRKLSEQVEEQLLTAINQNVFSTEEYLPGENKLAELFKVSRGVVREALLMLSAKGIIDMQKGKGALVLKPSIDSFINPLAILINFKCGNKSLKYIQAARIVIEPQVAALSAEFRTERDISTLSTCIDNMGKPNRNKNMLAQYDIEFHKIISDSCNNPIFPIVLDPIYHVMTTYHQETYRDAVSDQVALNHHQHIFSAIKARNSEGAFKIMQEHLNVAEKDLEKLYSNE